MELTCPSCARKHLTENHKNDFEITCKCGYSLLIPDESALQREVDQAEQEQAAREGSLDIVPNTNAEPPLQATAGVDDPIFSTAPATLDAQDEAFVIPGQALVNPTDPLQSENGDGLLQNDPLTPPDQLPDGMVYDPFEIPNPISTPASQEPTDMPSGLQANFTPRVVLEEPRTKPPKATPPPGGPKPSTPPPVQVLIEKSIRSSLGQMLGSSYNLKISDLDSTHLKTLRIGASQFCHNRPWLGEELKKRNIILDDIRWEEWIENLPEPLAIEIYLKAMELGGDCQFALTA